VSEMSIKWIFFKNSVKISDTVDIGKVEYSRSSQIVM